jgi:protoheme ferro-lyase
MKGKQSKSYEQIDDKIIIFFSYHSLPQELRVARSAGEM